MIYPVKKVSILGQTWDIREIEKDDDPYLQDCDGYTDRSIQEIVVRHFTDQEMDDIGAIADFRWYRDKVLRHELLHAYMYEAGLSDYAADETLVEWLACNFAKIQKTFTKLGCEDIAVVG